MQNCHLRSSSESRCMHRCKTAISGHRQRAVACMEMQHCHLRSSSESRCMHVDAKLPSPVIVRELLHACRCKTAISGRRQRAVACIDAELPSPIIVREPLHAEMQSCHLRSSSESRRMQRCKVATSTPCKEVSCCSSISTSSVL